MENIQITQWCAHFISRQVHPGDLCIDATMGNGNDTLLLSRLCEENGRVLAFDIQRSALEKTKERLLAAGAPLNYSLILDSHTNMAKYAREGSVSCIVFNFGYLPGGSHETATKAETSIGGLLSLCIYSGGDSGFEEKDAILSWLKKLPPRRFLVIKSDYYNRPNHPPVPVLVIKL